MCLPSSYNVTFCVMLRCERVGGLSAKDLATTVFIHVRFHMVHLQLIFIYMVVLANVILNQHRY